MIREEKCKLFMLHIILEDMNIFLNVAVAADKIECADNNQDLTSFYLDGSWKDRKHLVVWNLHH